MPDLHTLIGLREQKRQRTYNSIQSHALRLFRERGYSATSVTEIAAASGISEATFYRYFPTKEDVVLQDSYDPMLLVLFDAQPQELNPVQALRAAFQQILGNFSEVEKQDQKERIALVTSEPKLRARILDQITDTIQLLVEPLAKRSGRSTDDFAVLTVAGAIMGACVAVIGVMKEDPNADLAALVDKALAQLEAGLVL
ncbi:MAG TPA: TetR family transcriptional regulator [Candidatus Saccharimonadia bacterium]|nr:TetR family transcriptional regulator [Candidatus Saccharimonadia bacterium]